MIQEQSFDYKTENYIVISHGYLEGKTMRPRSATGRSTVAQGSNPTSPQQNTSSFQVSSIIGTQSIMSQSGQQKMKKGQIQRPLHQHEISQSEYYWDYLFISWIFCFIFALKDQSACLDQETVLSFSMRTFLIVQGSTTLAQLLCLIVFWIVDLESIRDTTIAQGIHSFTSFWALVLSFFKLAWPFQVFLAALFSLNFEQCSNFLIEYFVAYLVGIYFLGKAINYYRLASVKYAKKSEILIEQMLIKQQMIMTFSDKQGTSFCQRLQLYYFTYFKYEVEKRIAYALSTFFGLYLIAKDTQSRSLKNGSVLKVWLILTAAFELILPVVALVRFLVTAAKQYSNRLKASHGNKPTQNKVTKKTKVNQPAHKKIKEAKNQNNKQHKYIFLHLTKINLVFIWQFLCFSFLLVFFCLTVYYPLAYHSDVLKKYLLFHILFRLVYYRNALLVYNNVIRFDNEKFRQGVVCDIIQNGSRIEDEKASVVRPVSMGASSIAPTGPIIPILPDSLVISRKM